MDSEPKAYSPAEEKELPPPHDMLLTKASPPMGANPRPKFPLWILPVIAFLIVLGAATFYFLDRPTVVPQKKAPLPITAITPTVTPDPIADWHSYTLNTVDGQLLTLKYPNGWIYEDKNSKNKFYSYDRNSEKVYFGVLLTEDHVGDKVPAYPSSELIITVTKDAGTITPSKFEKNFSNVYKTDNTIINNLQLFEVYYSGSVSGDSYAAFFKKNNNLYTLESPYSATKPHIDKIHTMVSTFSFSKQDATPSASQVACTQEAKLCPDGKTYVSRTGPNCEFSACPK